MRNGGAHTPVLVQNMSDLKLDRECAPTAHAQYLCVPTEHVFALGATRGFIIVVVCHSWMNRKARAEGCERKGYLCYEAGKAATCMAECPPHTWCAGLEI